MTTNAALLSPVPSSLEFVAPAEDLDESSWPFYARPSQKPVLLAPPRVVRVGMQATGPSGERVVVKKISMECGDIWATVKRLDNGTESEMPLSSLH